MSDPYNSDWRTYLRYGDSGDDVKWLQRHLKAQGFFKGQVLGNFRALTQNALRYFQSTHIGRDGDFLEADGIFGPETMWAIQHPSGIQQRNYIDPLIPEGLGGTRRDILETVVADWRSGLFYEDPDGSNTGPRISEFSRGAPWCCFYQSDAWHRTFDEYPLGKDHGHCLTFWREADSVNAAWPKKKSPPLPGDLGVILYRNRSGNLTGSGHIFLVSGVSGTGRQFNAFGGNEGNRLKHGLRSVDDPNIVGWIDLHGDDRRKVDFAKGIQTSKTSTSSHSNTR